MKLSVDSPPYVVGYAALISAAFTAAVMAVHVATAAKIRRNEQLREQRALVKVFGLGDVEQMASEDIADLKQRRIDGAMTVRDPVTGGTFQVFRAYTKDGAPGTWQEDDLFAVGFRIRGRGFWAPITGLMALRPDLDEVIGVVFLDHGETPGLGGRITEDWFQDQFRGLNVAPPPEGAEFVYVEREKPRSEKDPRYGRAVDAITGATQTSMAVGRLINGNIAQFRRAWEAGPVRPAPGASE